MEANKKPRILIVDDDQLNLHFLAEVVSEAGYDLVLAKDGKQVFDCIGEEKPDLILLDVMMPGMDGYEVCNILKQQWELKDIPIIFLTAKTDTADIIRGFEAGGEDYVLKPFNATELKMRIKNHLALKRSRDELKEYNQKLLRINEELKKAYDTIQMKNSKLEEIMERLDWASKTDPLTGLFNRRYIIEKMEEECKRYKRFKKRFSLIVADIDFFKKVNDTYGHDCGDFVLRFISKTLNDVIREQDFACRWGGEEFLLLLPETEIQGACVLAERIRGMIEEQLIQFNKVELSVTITLGVASIDDYDTIDDTIKRADNALFEGKSKGRNCVVCF